MGLESLTMLAHIDELLSLKKKAAAFSDLVSLAERSLAY